MRLAGFVTSPNNPLRVCGSSCSNVKSSNRTIIPEACCHHSTWSSNINTILNLNFEYKSKPGYNKTNQLVSVGVTWTRFNKKNTENGGR